MTSDAVMQLGSWATLISSRRCLKVIDTFRKGRAEDARAYNEVVTGWSGSESVAGGGGEEQRVLFE